MKKIIIIFNLFFLSFFMGCVGKSQKEDLSDQKETIKKYKMKKGGFEPSGVTKLGEELYIISDNAKAAIFYGNGKIKYLKLKIKGDFEGITTDGEYFYIVSESKDSIVKTSKKFDFIKEYKVKRKFNGEKVLKKKGNGLEAVTFLYEDEKGKHFIVANQSYKRRGKGKSALLFVLLSEDGAKTYKYVPMKIVDISGLYYDNKKDLLYVLSDIDDKVYVFKLRDLEKGRFIKELKVPGEEQEGIFLDGKFLYIADDKGKFFQIKI